jgi:hypothetical protein
MNTMPQKASEQKLLTDHPVLLMVGDKGLGKKLHEPEALSINEVQRRAETMTPLLQEILDFRPRPRWG